mmetsp:Transcript_66746/g.144011  ORF Transcript_66746/g.144011 Transcript_66746/m.144011 type:complete len:405 (+) Transcript_66746:933-2147(+)
MVLPELGEVAFAQELRRRRVRADLHPQGMEAFVEGQELLLAMGLPPPLQPLRGGHEVHDGGVPGAQLHCVEPAAARQVRDRAHGRPAIDGVHLSLSPEPVVLPGIAHASPEHRVATLQLDLHVPRQLVDVGLRLADLELGGQHLLGVSPEPLGDLVADGEELSVVRALSALRRVPVLLDLLDDGPGFGWHGGLLEPVGQVGLRIHLHFAESLQQHLQDGVVCRQDLCVLLVGLVQVAELYRGLAADDAGEPHGLPHVIDALRERHPPGEEGRHRHGRRRGGGLDARHLHHVLHLEAPVGRLDVDDRAKDAHRGEVRPSRLPDGDDGGWLFALSDLVFVQIADQRVVGAPYRLLLGRHGARRWGSPGERADGDVRSLVLGRLSTHRRQAPLSLVLDDRRPRRLVA